METRTRAFDREVLARASNPSLAGLAFDSYSDWPTPLRHHGFRYKRQDHDGGDGHVISETLPPV